MTPFVKGKARTFHARARVRSCDRSRQCCGEQNKLRFRLKPCSFPHLIVTSRNERRRRHATCNEMRRRTCRRVIMDECLLRECGAADPPAAFKSCVRSSTSLVCLSLSLPFRFPDGQPTVSINLAIIMTVMAAACRRNNVAETFNHAKFRDPCLQKSGRLLHLCLPA